jgi:hypothetical protein
MEIRRKEPVMNFAARAARWSAAAVEKHVAAILAKLRLPPSESDHRRVLAVVTYLQGDRPSGRSEGSR